MTGIVYFIGAGPGDPGLLTLKGKQIIDSADLIVYAGSLVNPAVLAGARDGAEVVDSAPRNLQEIVEKMIAAAQAGKTVARVHTGDPSLYGAIAEQLALLRDAGIACAVVPGVSSVFAAAAALQLEYTRPGGTQTLILTRRAGRTPVPPSESLAALAAHGSSMAIFLSAGMVEQTVAELLAGGYAAETPAAVVYRASWPDEHCVIGTLATIADQAAMAGIARQALILVGDAVGMTPAEQSRLYATEFVHGFRAIPGKKREGTAVVALTRRGWHTGMRIIGSLADAELFLPAKFQDDVQSVRISFYEDIATLLGRLFRTRAQLVLIMATGIAVRMLTPFIASKWDDPAVVTMDDSGRNIISLLSGHWGGANLLTEDLARILGGNPVITTESDVMGFPAIDLIIKRITGAAVPEDPALVKQIQTAVLEGDPVGFYPEALRLLPNMQGHPNVRCYASLEELLAAQCAAGVVVSCHRMPLLAANRTFLLVHPRNLMVGIGCHRGTPAEEIARGVAGVFAEHNLALESIAAVCTVDKKKDEGGLIDFAGCMGVPLEIFSSADVNKVAIVSPESIAARDALGLQGVAEPAALLGSAGGRLLVPKVKLDTLTIAVAERQLRNLIADTDDDIDE